MFIFLFLFFCLVYWSYLALNDGYIIANMQLIELTSGYIIEMIMSVDNVFVWLILFKNFNIPICYQNRILIYSSIGSIILRTIMILLSNLLIHKFKWLLYIFAFFLVFTGIKINYTKTNEINFIKKILIKLLYTNNLRIINNIESRKFFIRKNGLLFITPLLTVLILIELSDIIFAVDSIPAIFSITKNTFIMLILNLFSILSMRTIYFQLANLVASFSILSYGLSLILIFMGIKIIISDLYYISIIHSLAIIFMILVLTLGIDILRKLF